MADGATPSAGLDPGDYIACEVAQADWVQSFPSSGADCTTDSGATDLAPVGPRLHHRPRVRTRPATTSATSSRATKTGTKYEDVNGDGDLTTAMPTRGLDDQRLYQDDGNGILEADRLPADRPPPTPAATTAWRPRTRATTGRAR